MNLSDIEAELASLLRQMDTKPEDLHEVHEKIREKLNEMRAFGMPVPEDLLKLERDLAAALNAPGEEA